MLLAALAWTLLQAAPACVAPDKDHAAFAAVLKAYVQGGAVDYAQLSKKPGPLDAYVAALERTCPEGYAKLTREEQLAFLINAYNAAVLQLIAAQPGVASIEQIDGGEAFKRPRLQLGPVVGAKEAKLSLDALETAIRAFKEPRIHFALVCAAKSCPPLRSEPYTGKQLEAQLEAQTRDFLGSPRGVVIRANGEVALSRLFEWYATDFGGVRKFLARYRPELPADGGGYHIAFLPYDWSLNGR